MMEALLCTVDSQFSKNVLEGRDVEGPTLEATQV